MTVDANGSEATEFRTALPDLQQSFIEAYNSRDLARVVELYADDAYVVRPNREVVRGRDAIREYHAGRMQSGQRFLSMTTLTVVAEATAAIEVTDAMIEFSGLESGVVRQTSRLVAIWKRQADGAWKLDADVFV
jgi:uncharacterized protein (TIGR02246 family)